MKRTDIERRQRELERTEKRQRILERKGEARSSSTASTIGEFIDELHDLYRYDEERIYNLKTDADILVTLESMKNQIPEKKWEDVIRKSIKKSKVKEKDEAYAILWEIVQTL